MLIVAPLEPIRTPGAFQTAGAEAAAFVPTGALQFLRALHAARPNHCLLAADFDFLPEVSSS